MLVVVDSNQLFGYLAASRPARAWQRLLGMSAAGAIELVLPEVVQWELVNQYREDVTARASRYKTAEQQLRRLGISPPAFGNLAEQVSELVAEAGERLRQTLLWHRGRIAPVPDVSPSQLVRRSLERRPPFDAEDRGMRDTLIWLTVLELAAEGTDIVLVSADDRAFGDGSLHPALAREASELVDRSTPVTLSKTLEHAIELIIERTGSTHAAAERGILGNDDVVAAVMAELSTSAELFITAGDDVTKQGWPDELASYRLLEVVDWGGLSIESARLESDGEIRATVALVAAADLDVRSSWLEYPDFEELVNGAEIDDIGVGFLDGLEQTRMRRDVVIVGDVVLTPDDSAAQVRVTEVRLSRRALRAGQLAFELVPGQATFTWREPTE